MTIFYFTSTGNSLDVSRRFNCTLVSIPQELKKDPTSYDDDKIGFVFPAYFHGIPRPVLKFIRSAQFNSSYFFSLITCGGSSGAASWQLQKEFKKKKIQINYIADITMIDNYVPMFDIAREQSRLSTKNVESALPAAVHDIRASVNRIPVRGFFIKRVHSIAQMIYNRLLDKTDKKLFVDKTCNLCGTCALVCLADNISVTDKVAFDHRCESCFACLHNCPQKAIHHTKEKSAVRYRNRNISLQDIIEANK
ncbi:MAG: EFR1 family ferrodoxin [Spirochaetes bacterium]|jgi:ferredoxin|nr:EFR1 family ferrodoxin [Spirochaetota bacterium]